MKSEHEPCAYCGARPTWWRYDDGTTYTVYLCADCDDDEIAAFDDKPLPLLDRLTSREDGLARG
jgi:hypothetical protein